MAANPIQFFTIIATNYAGQAACLGESLAAQHPEAEFTVWLIDQGQVPPEAGHLNYHRIGEILDENRTYALKLRYDLMEFATSVKPFICSHLFEQGAEKVCYIDPDIYFFKPMSKVMEALDGSATGVLTPHMLSPMPADGRRPNDKDILTSGVYNLGFIGLRKCDQTMEFLTWWWAWLQKECYSSPTSGVFTDQKWVNFAPVFFKPFEILSDPGYNIAYWNLHEREITKSGDEWQCNGKPLTFYHFSGFDHRHPGELSKHQNRFKIEQGSDLANLLSFYAGKMKQYGGDQAREIKVPRIGFEDGERLDHIASLALDRAMALGVPFETIGGEGQGSFREYLLTAESGQTHNNYALELFRFRPDLARIFSSKEPMLVQQWIENNGVTELNLNPNLSKPRSGSPTKIAYAGYLNSALGIGEAARGYISALRSAGYAPTLVDFPEFAAGKQDKTLKNEGVSSSIQPGTSLAFLHINADQLPDIIKTFNLRPSMEPAYCIGNWAWETAEFPDKWQDRFNLLDEVWAGSKFITEALAKNATVPVVTVPYIVEVPNVLPDRQRFKLDLQEFVFLFTFDFLSFFERKNPHAVLDAFLKAFKPTDPVRLLIKSQNGFRKADEMSALLKVAEGSRVTLMDEALDSNDRYILLQSCDAYISLHRAEGFGLGLGEAMAYGKPAIATGWSGNMEFMTPWNSFPVDFTLEPLDQKVGPYPAGTMWAVPDINDAADKMRQVWQDKDLRERIGHRAKEDMANGFSPEAVGRIARVRIEHILKYGGKGNKHFDALPSGPGGIPNLKRRLIKDVFSRPGHYLSRSSALFKTYRSGGPTALKNQMANELRSQKQS